MIESQSLGGDVG